MAFGFPPKHIEEIKHVDLTKEQFMALALEAIKILQWNVSRVSNNRISAYRSMSLSSWGEEIIIEVDESVGSIESKCTSLQLIDWGRNKKNVEEFIETCLPLVETISGNELVHKVKKMISSFPSYSYSQIEETPDEKPAGFLSLFMLQKGYLITPIITYLNIAIFIIMVIMGVDIFLPSAESVLKFGANFRPLTLQGEWWRLLTSCFIHFGVFHLLINLYALLYIGMLLEPLLGSTRFSIAYLLTGLTGSIASLYWHAMTVSAGASGAIFGMYGVFLSLLTTKFIEEAKRRSLLTSIGIFVAYNLLNGLEGNIDNAAHIGGLLGGFFVGYCYYFSLKKPEDVQLKVTTIFFSIFFLVSTTYFVFANTTSDLSVYKKNMETFVSLEAQAIQGIQSSHEPSNDSILVALKECGIRKWRQAIVLLDKTDKLQLPQELHKRNQLLIQYCEIRIQSYAFLCRVFEGKAEINSIEGQMINNQLKKVIGEIEGNIERK